MVALGGGTGGVTALVLAALGTGGGTGCDRHLGWCRGGRRSSLLATLGIYHIGRPQGPTEHSGPIISRIVYGRF